MLSSLRNHPFAVEAHFDHSLVLTYALPKERLESLIPECLTLDTFDDRWAFVAVAMVQTRALRPSGFPKFAGNNFFLIGYRIFVRYTTAAGKNWRGLYILRSATDRKKMEVLGNLFTNYRYITTDIQQNAHANRLTVNSLKSNLHVEVETGAGDIALPDSSPFPDWKTARRFAGPMPFTFSYNAQTRGVTIIEGVRENWTPQPVRVIDQRVGFLTSQGLGDAQLANAFLIRDIPYRWKKGRTEVWKG